MKKLFLISLTLISLLFSCKTLSNTVSYPQKDGTLIFVTPTTTKNKDIPFYSFDLTLFLTENKDDIHSVAKYSVVVKDKTKSQLENLNISLVIGSEVYNLEHKTIYVDKYKKNSLQIRFESDLGFDVTENLITSDSPVFMIVSDNSGFESQIDMKKIKEKINELRIYF